MEAPAFQIVGYVIGANLLTLACLWGVWTIHQAEKRTGDGAKAPGWAFIAAIAPLLVVAMSGYLGLR